MFQFDFSDYFRRTLNKLAKKDPVIAKAINKKVKEIISRDNESVMLYKNLSKDLKTLKRIHITQWLVMTFAVELDKNLILFVNIEHRDKVYKKRR